MAVLPVKYPMATSYGSIAYTLSALEAHEESLPWIYNHFIQVIHYTKITGNTFDSIGGNFIEGHDGGKKLLLFAFCPFFRYYKYERKILNLKEREIDAFIIAAINNNRYIGVFVDLFYLPCSQCYKKFHKNDAILIYGYNFEKDEIHTAYFYRGNKYSFQIISFSDFRDAYSNVLEGEDEYLDSIILFGYKRNESYEKIDMKQISESVEDYILSRDSTKKYYHNNLYQIHYGISYYDELKETIQEGRLDHRDISILYDEKLIMRNRILFLKNFMCFPNQEIEFLLDDLIISLKKYVMFAIKSELSGKNYKEELIAQTELCKNKDLVFMKGFLSELKLS